VKVDIKRRQECLWGDCGMNKGRCVVRYGNLCIKLGGNRIPVQTATIGDSFPLVVQAQTTFKPYFISNVDELEDD